MANLPLFLFTLLGGMAAGTYLAETCLERKRGEANPWLVPAVALALVAVGAVAATFHVGNIARAFTLHVNLGAGMTQEVLLAAVFGVLVLVDLVLCAAKKQSPFALRVCGAVAAVLLMLSMGHAYTTVLGNPVWAQPVATILSFFAGSLLSGLLLCYGQQRRKGVLERCRRAAGGWLGRAGKRVRHLFGERGAAGGGPGGQHCRHSVRVCRPEAHRRGVARSSVCPCPGGRGHGALGVLRGKRSVSSRAAA